MNDPRTMSPPAMPSQAAPSSLPMNQPALPLNAKERGRRAPKLACERDIRPKDFLQRLREAGL